MADKNPVAARTSKSTDRMDASDLPRALMAGTQGMRDKGPKYLPQFAMETGNSWAARRDASFLFNAYKRAWMTMVGKPFTSGVTFTDESPLPDRALPWVENIDLTGQHHDVFAKHVFGDSLHSGVGHILVDTTNRTGQARMTVRQAEEQGIRPYWVYIPAENVLGIQSENIGGRTVLTMMRIEETSTEPDGEFGEDTVNRVRVLRRADEERPFATVQVYREVEGEWVAEGDEESLEPHVEIPIATFYAHRTGFMDGRPALEDLAWLNLEHWQSASDQRNILHFARVPFYHFAGFSKEEMENFQAIGSGSRVSSSEPGATVSTVEFEGSAISAGVDDLNRIKEEMTVVSVEPFVPRDISAKTATEVRAQELRSDSGLMDWVRNFEDTLEEAWRITFAAAGIDSEEPSVELDRNWKLSEDMVERGRMIIEAWSKGMLTGRDDLKASLMVLSEYIGFPDEWDADESAQRWESNGQLRPAGLETLQEAKNRPI